MDMMSNKKKGKRGKSSRKSSRKKPKKATSRAPRGLVAPYLPFRAKTYGRNLPDWAAMRLGWTGDTVPVVSVLPGPSSAGDLRAIDYFGAPLNKPKAPAKPKVSKFDRLTDQLNKAISEFSKAIATGAKTERLDKLREKIANLEGMLIKERLLHAEVAGQLAGLSPANIERRLRAVERDVQRTSGTPRGRVSAARSRAMSDPDARALRQALDTPEERRTTAMRELIAERMDTDVQRALGAMEGRRSSLSAAAPQAAAATGGSSVDGFPLTWSSWARSANQKAAVEEVASPHHGTWASPEDAKNAAVNLANALDGNDPSAPSPSVLKAILQMPAEGRSKLQNKQLDIAMGFTGALQNNPEVAYRFRDARGKERRAILEMTPVDRKTPGAISVVVGPQAYRYATLALKELRNNGLLPGSKDMAKRRMHANPLTDDLMALGKPVLGATAGFAASRAVNALALMGVSKMAKEGERPSKTMESVARLAATGAGIAATLTVGNNVALIRDNRTSIVTGMALNLIEGLVRRQAESMLANARDSQESPYLRDMALGSSSYYDVSHAGAPYSPMMGEYVSQSLNGMGEYVSQSLNGGMGGYIAQAAAGMGEYVSQSLNGGDGLGEYVSQSLNGFGEYAEGVDPSDQEGVDGMINTAEAVAGLSGTEVMAATAGLGMTEVMAATAGLGATQGMNRGIVTRRGVYNFFTQPVMPGRANIPAVSIEDAPMPVVNMGGAVPGAVPISDQVSTPEGRGYAGGIFGRHIFGTMV
jgi:hypothetical protein